MGGCAVGWTPQNPYIHGVIYPEGPLAPGSLCVAPVLLLQSALNIELKVAFDSRVTPGAALGNSVVLEPEGFVVLPNLLPSVPGYTSQIDITDAQGESLRLILEHDPVDGYLLQQVTGPSAFAATITAPAYREPEPACTGAFSLGGHIMVPVRISRRR